jgi:subtilisin family serine protease
VSRARGACLALALLATLPLSPAAAGAAAPAAAVIVHVRPSALALVPLTRGEIAGQLRRRARRDQAGLLHALRAAERRGEASDIVPLWIDDAIALHARPALLERLRRRPDVGGIEPDRPLRIEPAGLTLAAADLPAASVAATGAPALWAEGQTGRGAVIAVLDTGLVAGFPQLSRARGSWFDPYEQHKTPYDEDVRAHGTEVADIIVAMAPDVRLMAARVFSDGGRSSTSSVHRVFEWVLDPDDDPATDDSPDVVNGSWDDGGPGHCEREFDGDIAALRAAGVVPVFAAGNSGPAAGSGGSPASTPGAVSVGSVSAADVVSPFSGRGPSPCGGGPFPTLSAYGEGITLQAPGGSAVVVSGTSFAAPQVSGALALLAAMFPGSTPEALVAALVNGARDIAVPGADSDTGAGVLDVAHAAALLAGADHAGPRVTINARWSQDSAHLGLVLSGVAHERGGGTGSGVTASAFISLHGVPAKPLALTATPRDATSAALAGLVPARKIRRIVDGRHHLFVHARDASGNWGPVRAVVLPIDRIAPGIRVSGGRRGDVVSALLHVRERGSGLVLLRYRLETAGRIGRWHVLRPAAQAHVTLHAAAGRKAILRVRAVDVVGNATVAGFDLPR